MQNYTQKYFSALLLTFWHKRDACLFSLCCWVVKIASIALGQLLCPNCNTKHTYCLGLFGTSFILSLCSLDQQSVTMIHLHVSSIIKPIEFQVRSYSCNNIVHTSGVLVQNVSRRFTIQQRSCPEPPNPSDFLADH